MAGGRGGGPAAAASGPSSSARSRRRRRRRRHRLWAGAEPPLRPRAPPSVVRVRARPRPTPSSRERADGRSCGLANGRAALPGPAPRTRPRPGGPAAQPMAVRARLRPRPEDPPPSPGGRGLPSPDAPRGRHAPPGLGAPGGAHCGCRPPTRPAHRPNPRSRGGPSALRAPPARASRDGEARTRRLSFNMQGSRTALQVHNVTRRGSSPSAEWAGLPASAPGSPRAPLPRRADSSQRARGLESTPRGCFEQSVATPGSGGATTHWTPAK